MNNQLIFHFDIGYLGNKGEIGVSYCSLTVGDLYYKTFAEMSPGRVYMTKMPVTQFHKTTPKMLEEIVRDDVIAAEHLKETNVIGVGWPGDIDDIHPKSLRHVSAEEVAGEVDRVLTQRIFSIYRDILREQIIHTEEITIDVSWNDNGGLIGYINAKPLNNRSVEYVSPCCNRTCVKCNYQEYR